MNHAKNMEVGVTIIHTRRIVSTICVGIVQNYACGAKFTT